MTFKYQRQRARNAPPWQHRSLRNT